MAAWPRPEDYGREPSASSRRLACCDIYFLHGLVRDKTSPRKGRQRCAVGEEYELVGLGFGVWIGLDARAMEADAAVAQHRKVKQVPLLEVGYDHHSFRDDSLEI